MGEVIRIFHVLRHNVFLNIRPPSPPVPALSAQIETSQTSVEPILIWRIVSMVIRISVPAYWQYWNWYIESIGIGMSLLACFDIGIRVGKNI